MGDYLIRSAWGLEQYLHWNVYEQNCGSSQSKSSNCDVLPSGFPGKAWDPTLGLKLSLHCWLAPSRSVTPDQSLDFSSQVLEWGEV